MPVQYQVLNGGIVNDDGQAEVQVSSFGVWAQSSQNLGVVADTNVSSYITNSTDEINGRVILSVLPTGRTDRLTSRELANSFISALNSRYSGRFDDKSYYGD